MIRIVLLVLLCTKYELLAVFTAYICCVLLCTIQQYSYEVLRYVHMYCCTGTSVVLVRYEHEDRFAIRCWVYSVQITAVNRYIQQQQVKRNVVVWRLVGFSAWRLCGSRRKHNTQPTQIFKNKRRGEKREYSSRTDRRQRRLRVVVLCTAAVPATPASFTTWITPTPEGDAGGITVQRRVLDLRSTKYEVLYRSTSYTIRVQYSSSTTAVLQGSRCFDLQHFLSLVMWCIVIRYQ